ncbi:TrkH family potassium uptake protein [bacterium]|nr:TrkH family potassium uptake protein [bacterium]
MRNRFRTVNIVLNTLGLVLIVLGWFLLIPLIVLFLYEELGVYGGRTLLAFVIPSIFSLSIGFLLKSKFKAGVPNSIQAMLVCSLGWLFCSALGSIPFIIALKSTFLNSFFETISGFTTTGITIFTGLEQMPRSILFWRNFTEWIGGLGILTFFLTVTYRGGGAHQLFSAESHKIGMPRLVPGLFNTLKIIWSIYIGYTIVIMFSLFIARMPFFDSICHAFTAVSTGGFSPHDVSIQYYQLTNHPNYIWIEYILIVGMLMGGINFFIHYRLANEGPRALLDNIEMRYWWGAIGLFVLVIFVERLVKVMPETGFADTYSEVFRQLEENFRIVLFQVISIITTTGFLTRDIGGTFFGSAARQLFLIMMVIGGCIGSTSGGIKVLRIAVLVRLIEREISRVLNPRKAISMIIIDGKPVDDDEIKRVSALFFSWIILLCLGGVVTTLLSGHDSYASFSGMFSALGNIGPCYITTPQIAELHPIIKVVYILGMLAGRLEIIPILLLFSGKAWQS